MHPWLHFKTITRHHNMVMRYCFRCGIPVQGLFHDLSKYAPVEFHPGAKYYLGDKSPNVGERLDIGYSVAWMHHKGRNKHHFEYWTDLSAATGRYEPVKMPLKYVKEMFCDRVAASRVYRGKDYDRSYPLAYLTRGYAKANMHPETYALMEKMLTVLATDGEAAACRYVRKLKSY